MSVCGQQADTSGGYQSTEYTDPPSTSGNIARNRSHTPAACNPGPTPVNLEGTYGHVLLCA